MPKYVDWVGQKACDSRAHPLQNMPAVKRKGIPDNENQMFRETPRKISVWLKEQKNEQKNTSMASAKCIYSADWHYWVHSMPLVKVINQDHMCLFIQSVYHQPSIYTSCVWSSQHIFWKWLISSRVYKGTWCEWLWLKDTWPAVHSQTEDNDMFTWILNTLNERNLGTLSKISPVKYMWLGTKVCVQWGGQIRDFWK